MIKFSESGHPVFRSTSPLSRGTLKSKGGGKLSIHFCAERERLKLFFAQLFLLISSVFTEHYESCPVRTGSPVLVGQSDPLFVPTSVMKTPTPSTDDPSQEDLLQKYQERVDKLSQQNRVIKFCTDAGFLTRAVVGQYFMIKDTEEFSQFTESVACREYTLPRDETSLDPKCWIRGNTTIGPVLE